MVKQLSARLAPAQTPQHQRPTVLVVDDELLIRESLGRFLQRSGYAVLAVADPDTAMRRLRKSVVDAVILDVRLAEGRSGLEVLEAIRLDEDLANLPVIVLTGVYFLTAADETLIQRHRAYLYYKPQIGRMLIERLDELTGQGHQAES